MKKDLVSIIVPVYNAATYLPRTIKSILVQTYVNFELVLVDDGSPDNSGIICDEYAQKDSRIKVIHKVNEGAAIARSTGVANASGKWITFVDADDILLPAALEELIKLDKGCFDIIAGTLTQDEIFTYKSAVKGDIDSQEYIAALLAGKTYIGPCAKIIKKELFCSSREKSEKIITNNEDLLMLIEVSVKAKRVYIDDNLVCYNYIPIANSASGKVMPLNTWVSLFNRIESLLGDVLHNNNNIKCAFTKFRLKRVYYCILNGFFVNNKDIYISNLISESTDVTLDDNDQYIISVIKSKAKQMWLCYSLRVKQEIKDTIKVLLGKRIHKIIHEKRVKKIYK